MLIGMMLRRFGSMVFSVQAMTVGHVGMVGALMVVALLVVLGGGSMMFGGVIVVIRGFSVMVNVVFGHGIPSLERV
jgi:hypothetical protein